MWQEHGSRTACPPTCHSWMLLLSLAPGHAAHDWHVPSVLQPCNTLYLQWIIQEVKASGLRGRGGAGFSTGMKWWVGGMGGSSNDPEWQPRTRTARCLVARSSYALLFPFVVG